MTTGEGARSGLSLASESLVLWDKDLKSSSCFLIRDTSFLFDVFGFGPDRCVFHMCWGVGCNDLVNEGNGGARALPSLIAVPVVFDLVDACYALINGEGDPLLLFASDFSKAVVVIFGASGVIARHASFDPVGGVISPLFFFFFFLKGDAFILSKYNAW